MKDRFIPGKAFECLRAAVAFFTPKMCTAWAEPHDGEPCVFVCNHARAYGPIAMCAHFPLAKQSTPWIISNMMHAKEVPAYVRRDFWWQRDRWYTKLLDYTLAYVYALLLPPVMRGIKGIPVYHDMRSVTTFRDSVKAVRAGRNLIIFPEQPTGFEGYADVLSDGFALIAKQVFRATGKALKFYPVYVDWGAHTIDVGRAIRYDPHSADPDQTKHIVQQLSATVLHKNVPAEQEEAPAAAQK